MNVSEDTPPGVTHAVVLAAGDGDRFRNGSRTHKLLHPFLGRPLLLRTLESAYEAGIRRATVVLGCEAGQVRELVETGVTPGLEVSYVVNDQWHLENGLSVLAAKERAGGEPVVLLMGDHVFDPEVLQQLRTRPLVAGHSVLAVDARPADPAIAAEATKVRLEGSRIIAIGKHLAEYDALDTGMFVCDPSLFDALEESRAGGDTTLSGGIRVLASRGVMRAFDIGGAGWRDIDTVGDLEEAELAMARLLQTQV